MIYNGIIVLLNNEQLLKIKQFYGKLKITPIRMQIYFSLLIIHIKKTKITVYKSRLFVNYIIDRQNLEYVSIHTFKINYLNNIDEKLIKNIKTYYENHFFFKRDWFCKVIIVSYVYKKKSQNYK